MGDSIPYTLIKEQLEELISTRDDFWRCGNSIDCNQAGVQREKEQCLDENKSYITELFEDMNKNRLSLEQQRDKEAEMVRQLQAKYEACSATNETLKERIEVMQKHYSLCYDDLKDAERRNIELQRRLALPEGKDPVAAQIEEDERTAAHEAALKRANLLLSEYKMKWEDAVFAKKKAEAERERWEKRCDDIIDALKRNTKSGCDYTNDLRDQVYALETRVREQDQMIYQAACSNSCNACPCGVNRSAVMHGAPQVQSSSQLGALQTQGVQQTQGALQTQGAPRMHSSLHHRAQSVQHGDSLAQGAQTTDTTTATAGPCPSSGAGPISMTAPEMQPTTMQEAQQQPGATVQLQAIPPLNGAQHYYGANQLQTPIFYGGYSMQAIQQLSTAQQMQLARQLLSSPETTAAMQMCGAQTNGAQQMQAAQHLLAILHMQMHGAPLMQGAQLMQGAPQVQGALPMQGAQQVQGVQQMPGAMQIQGAQEMQGAPQVQGAQGALVIQGPFPLEGDLDVPKTSNCMATLHYLKSALHNNGVCLHGYEGNLEAVPQEHMQAVRLMLRAPQPNAPEEEEFPPLLYYLMTHCDGCKTYYYHTGKYQQLPGDDAEINGDAHAQTSGNAENGDASKSACSSPSKLSADYTPSNPGDSNDGAGPSGVPVVSDDK